MHKPDAEHHVLYTNIHVTYKTCNCSLLYIGYIESMLTEGMEIHRERSPIFKHLKHKHIVTQ